MWLPKDERTLLAGYSSRLGGPQIEEMFRRAEWVPVFSARCIAKAANAVPAYDEHRREEQQRPGSPEESQAEIDDYIDGVRKLARANVSLEARGLIKMLPHQVERGVFGVALTVQGYDLGRKYSTWFGRSGEWFKEYREHWVWLIVGFLGGILGSLVVHWLS